MTPPPSPPSYSAVWDQKTGKQTIVALGPSAVPTPGARAILNTFTRGKKDSSGSPAGTAFKSAKELLREHRQALTCAEKPVLGWGLPTGASTVSLDISNSSRRLNRPLYTKEMKTLY
jgi:hypothetical protein